MEKIPNFKRTKLSLNIKKIKEGVCKKGRYIALKFTEYGYSKDDHALVRKTAKDDWKRFVYDLNATRLQNDNYPLFAIGMEKAFKASLVKHYIPKVNYSDIEKLKEGIEEKVTKPDGTVIQAGPNILGHILKNNGNVQIYVGEITEEDKVNKQLEKEFVCAACGDQMKSKQGLSLHRVKWCKVLNK